MTSPAESTAVTGRRELASFVEAFEVAVRSAGLVERRIQVCDQRLLVRIAGSEMAAYHLPALDHLPSWSDAEPDLTILAWDTHTTGTSLPPDCAPLVEDKAWESALRPDRDGLLVSYHRGNSGLSLLDLAGGTAGYCVPNALTVPLYDRASPFRVILNWWLERSGIQMVHGAAVGTERGAVLVVGPGGSGKSTTAAACLEAGMLFAGDDYCPVRGGAAPVAWGLYSTSKLTESSIARVPTLERSIINPKEPDEGKFGVFLHPEFAERLAREMPVRAVLAPVIADAPETTFERISPVTALTVLAPSTLLQLPSADGRGLERMREIVGAVPCFRMRLGSDSAEVARAIKNPMATLPGGQG